MKKRIILLLDGTWNDADTGDADTNIVRLRERIALFLRTSQSQQQPARSLETSPSSASRGTVRLQSWKNDELENVVLYERGVGTSGFLDWLKGGAFGAGLSDNVRRAYKFLAQNYNEGDDIYIFGFSRGSYTARSLVGCLSAVGLLRQKKCDAKNVSLMWDHYRTDPADRLPAITEELAEKTLPVRVKCLGVFDTVGALGIPIPAFWRENRDLYGFHDVGLSQICDHSLHAVAIDEHREAFEATLWREEKFIAKEQAAEEDPHVEQVWFPGSHGDIGGGYIVENTRGNGKYVDDIPLDWMIRRVLETVDDKFPVVPGVIPSGQEPNYVAAIHHESRRGMYCLFPFVFRSIDNEPVPVAPWPLERNVCYDRHAKAIREAVHISAIERLGRDIFIDDTPAKYAPRNLIVAIRYAVQECLELPVVGWDGKKFDRSLSDSTLKLGLKRVLPWYYAGDRL